MRPPARASAICHLRDRAQPFARFLMRAALSRFDTHFTSLALFHFSPFLGFQLFVELLLARQRVCLGLKCGGWRAAALLSGVFASFLFKVVKRGGRCEHFEGGGVESGCGRGDF